MKGLLQWTDRQAPYRVNVQQVVTLDDLRRRIDELQRRHGTLGARLTHYSNADIKRPNPGQDYLQVRLGYSFQ